MGSYLGQLRLGYEDRLASIEARFQKVAAALRDHACWVKEKDYPEIALARYACGADWMIASRPGTLEGRPSVPRLADLIVTIGIPILLLGDRPEPLEGRRIVVGWHDSRYHAAPLPTRRPSSRTLMRSPSPTWERRATPPTAAAWRMSAGACVTGAAT